MTKLSVEAINVESMIALLTDQTMVPIVELNDAFGKRVYSEKEASIGICGRDGAWFVFKLEAFKEPDKH